MIEVLLSINGSILFAWLFALTYRIKQLELSISQTKSNLDSFKLPDIEPIVSAIREEILDTIGEMRPPTALDHVAGVWSQIMMMREQAKLVKDGILPNHVKEEPDYVE
jgi:hypothetical protein